MPDSAPPAVAVHTPTVKRRLMAMLYDLLLITAVEFFANFLFIFATGNRQTPLFRALGIVLFFLVAATYFLHAWHGSGFTLAMKTWHIKLIKVGHARVPFGVALLRHVLAWLWLLPALYLSHSLHLSHGQTALTMAIGIVVWALTAFLDKDRQFLHDKLAGTRLISLPKPAKIPAA
ncbi:MAG: RDD family protein [Pseudomonadota bacterium]|nr:RDD family protein [Pseudomonadota bacterium]